ncbi:hypothetical protein F4780DRAFT_400930 [Xylariomycetidae sp. FL0641]|nr:hypothetical protein F4780DRAFT_400930 [Xylariomycetidae sp. FL0641]
MLHVYVYLLSTYVFCIAFARRPKVLDPRLFFPACIWPSDIFRTLSLRPQKWNHLGLRIPHKQPPQVYPQPRCFSVTSSRSLNGLDWRERTTSNGKQATVSPVTST